MLHFSLASYGRIILLCSLKYIQDFNVVNDFLGETPTTEWLFQCFCVYRMTSDATLVLALTNFPYTLHSTYSCVLILGHFGLGNGQHKKRQ